MRRKILVGILLACLMLIPTSNGFNPSLVPMGGELTPLPALLTENHPPTATTIDPASEVSIEQLLGEDWYTNRQGIVDFAQSVGTQIGVPDYDIYENSEYILIVFNTGEKMQIDEEFSISKVKLILFDKTENEFIQKRNVAYSLYLEYYLQENSEEIAESIRSEIHDSFYSRLSGQVNAYANNKWIQDGAPIAATLATLAPILGGCLAAGPLGCEKGALLALASEEVDFVLSSAGTAVEYKHIVSKVSDRTSDASLLLESEHKMLRTTEDALQAIDYIQESEDIRDLIYEIEMYGDKLAKHSQCRSDAVRDLLHKYYKVRGLFILKELVHLSTLTVSAGSITRTAAFASLSGGHIIIADHYIGFVEDDSKKFEANPTFENYKTLVVNALPFYDHMQIACILVKATLESNREAGKLCTPRRICIPFTDICSWELPVICLPGTGEFAAWSNDFLNDLGLLRGMKVDEQIGLWRLCEQEVAGRQTIFLQRYHEFPTHIDASIVEIIDPFVGEEELPTTSDDDWPMIRWPMFRHGYIYCLNADNGNLIWKYQTGVGGGVDSSPNVVNGKVYIGSSDNYVYCLDADNGNLIWKYENIVSGVTSSPAVVNGNVYIGLHYVYCLNMDNGNLIWKYETGGTGHSSPAVVSGKVYCDGGEPPPSIGGYVYCLDADNGNLIWKCKVGVSFWSSPEVVNGKVYIGSWDDYIYCLDADNGDLIWKYGTMGGVASSPAVVNGKVYIGSWDDYIYCLDANNGDLIWKYGTMGDVASSPAVVNGKVYTGSSDNYVYCLDADNGDLIWKYGTMGGVESSPAVVNGKVYIGSWDDYIYCLDADNGDLIWKYETMGLVASSPAVVNGKVYIGSWDDYVYNRESDLIVEPELDNEELVDEEHVDEEYTGGWPVVPRPGWQN